MVAAANDRHTLQAVFAASRDGVIRPILVGERTGLNDLARELGHPLSPEQIVDGDGPEDCASRPWPSSARAGPVLVKGMLPTRTMLRAVVDHETGIRTGELMSHVAVLDVPSYPKLIFDTDGGMNVAPPWRRRGTFWTTPSSCAASWAMTAPRWGCCAAVETVSPNMPETQDAAALKAEAQTGASAPAW